MKSWIEHWARSWVKSGGTQIATLVVLVATYSVISLSLLFQGNLEQVIQLWGDQIQLEVYLKPNVSSQDSENIKKVLNSLPRIQSVEFISKEVAAQQFQKQMGHLSPDFLKDTEFGNPLPDLFTVRFLPVMNNEDITANLSRYANQLLKITGIEDVSYGQDWVENYASLVKFFANSSSIFILVLLSAAILVVSNSIRASIQHRRTEIEILELVGATSTEIRAPFIFEALINSIFASLIAIGMSFIIYLWISEEIKSSLALVSLSGQIRYLNFREISGVIAISAIFGVIGSYYCVKKIATGWAAAERH